MIFIGLFGIFAIAVILQIVLKKDWKILSYVFLTLIAIISSIRYGQGTDYFAYKNYFAHCSNNFWTALSDTSAHMNIGYRGITSLFKIAHLNYEIFIVAISIFMLFLYFKTIKKYSKSNLISVFILFSLYYQVYINSALRQALAMSIFFYAFFEYFLNNKHKKYILFVFIAGLFHGTVFIALFVYPIKFIYKRYNTLKLNIFYMIIALLGMVFDGTKIFRLILSLAKVGFPYESSGVSYMAVLYRVIMLIFIIYMYKTAEKSKVSENLKLTIYIYFWGVMFYLFISKAPILSRATVYLTLSSIIIIPNLIVISKNKINKICITIVLVAICSIMFFKGLDAFTKIGQYYHTGVTKYRYTTIFNKNEIHTYRNLKNDI